MVSCCCNAERRWNVAAWSNWRFCLHWCLSVWKGWQSVRWCGRCKIPSTSWLLQVWCVLSWFLKLVPADSLFVPSIHLGNTFVACSSEPVFAIESSKSLWKHCTPHYYLLLNTWHMSYIAEQLAVKWCLLLVVGATRWIFCSTFQLWQQCIPNSGQFVIWTVNWLIYCVTYMV
jgi:hypothetical protein